MDITNPDEEASFKPVALPSQRRGTYTRFLVPHPDDDGLVYALTNGGKADRNGILRYVCAYCRAVKDKNRRNKEDVTHFLPYRASANSVSANRECPRMEMSANRFVSILLPFVLCNVAFLPLIKMGATLRITPSKFEPNPAELQMKYSAGGTMDLNAVGPILAVHYFAAYFVCAECMGFDLLCWSCDALSGPGNRLAGVNWEG
ncbi:unnamed protein product [Bursaphelenchus xylophilus]|uniref:(pine wood nematode) hypothetical protein n=1 Tax=Bursaphelenchus xylophilus TaxID=6326 RepID=A0A1I7S6P7_BURXY|nr:unnamed protein product [Bursaphelenchus xylophilus]CAG9120650.1 unnamed protein product [Bursaphelenchus xylophilus]